MTPLLLLLFFPDVANAAVAPTISLTNEVPSPIVALRGDTVLLFTFNVTNNDTDEAILIDEVCVDFQVVNVAFDFNRDEDLDTLTVRNRSTGNISEATVTGSGGGMVCVSLAGRPDTLVSPSATSATFEVIVSIDTTSDGGRFTAEINDQNPGGGISITDTVGNLISPTHSSTTSEITIPIFRVNTAGVTKTKFFISPNSEIYPVVGLRLGSLGGQSPADDIDVITLRLHNPGGFIPGGGATDDLGDLEYLYVLKDDGDGSFDADGNKNPDDGSGPNLNGEALATILTRVKLGDLVGTVEQDSYLLDIPVTSGSGVDPTADQIPDLNDLPTIQSGTALKGSSFWIAIETNRRFSDDPNFNGVGAGDSWFIEVVSITGTFGGNSRTIAALHGDTTGPLISHTMTDIDSGRIIVPVHQSSVVSDLQPGGTPAGSEDGVGLDFLEFTPIFGFHMLGGNDFNNPSPPQIQRIVLQVFDPDGTIDLTTANSPLRAINNTRLSGIQLRRNRSNDGSRSIHALENGDVIVPIDQSLTTYENGSGVDTLTLVFTPDQLPKPSSSPHVKRERDPSGDPLTNGWNEVVVSVPSGNILPQNNEYWLAVMASDQADFGDTIRFGIPPGGIRFNNGVKSSSRFTAQSEIMFAPPVLFTDLVLSGDFLGESSPPTALLSFQLRGANRGESLALLYAYFIDTSPTGVPQLSESDFLDHDFDGLPFTNAEQSSGANLSGVAVYRDMNGNGLFEVGTDTVVPFDPTTLGPPTGTRFVSPGSDVNLLGGLKALHARMIFDISDPRTFYGDTTATFFLVVRSSGTIDPDDRFFAVVGDLDAVHDNGTYVDAEASGVWVASDLGVAQTFTNQSMLVAGGDIFGLVDDIDLDEEGGVPGWRREDHFRSKEIRGEALEFVVVNDLTVPFQTVSSGERTAVFGINLRAASGVSITLDSLAVVVFDTGTQTGDFLPTTDLAALAANDPTSGITVFLDNGTETGVFDAADQVAPMTSVDASNLLTTGEVVFHFSGIPVPDTDAADSAGNDLFVVINLSDQVTFRDDFVVAIPERAFGFSDASLKQPNGDTSHLLTAAMPVVLSAVGDTVLENDGDPRLAAFGIDAADGIAGGADGGVSLLAVKVGFENVNGFSLSDLRTLTTDSGSGVALYRDNGTETGVFDAADTLVPLASISASGLTVTLTIAGSGETVPDANTGADSGPDFFVVLRGDLTADVTTPDTFLVRLDTDALTWSTPFAAKPTATTGRIQFSGVPQTGITNFNPSRIFSPGNLDGIRDTTALRIQLPIEADSPVEVVLYLRDVNSGETFLSKTAKGPDTTVVFLPSDTRWLELEYGVRVFYSTASGTNVTGLAEKLVVDSGAPAPSATKQDGSPLPTSVSSTTLGIRVVVNLEAEASGDPNLSSQNRARLASENNEGFVVTIRIEGPQGESAVAVGTPDTRPAQTGLFQKDYALNLFNGVNLVSVVITDIAGNSETHQFTITAGAAAADIAYEGNEPVFRYSPSNPDFTFTLPQPAQSGGVEIFNTAGDKFRDVNATPGSPLISWDGRNNSGQLMRNGVYLVRFQVRLADGSTLSTVRTLFLLK